MNPARSPIPAGACARKAQLSLEALLALAGWTAFLLVLLQAVVSLQETTNLRGAHVSAAAAQHASCWAASEFDALFSRARVNASALDAPPPDCARVPPSRRREWR